MRTIRAITVLMLVAGAVALLPGRAWACSCVPPPPDAVALRDADAVFSGTVVAIHDPKAGKEIVSSISPLVYTFEVDAIAKGEVDEDQTVLSARNSASCGFSFENGKRYLVFATEAAALSGPTAITKDAVETNLCTNTHLLGADESLPFDAEPVAGSPPAPAGGKPVQDPAWPVEYMLVGLAIAAAVAAVSITLVRR